MENLHYSALPARKKRNEKHHAFQALTLPCHDHCTRMAAGGARRLFCNQNDPSYEQKICAMLIDSVYAVGVR